MSPPAPPIIPASLSNCAFASSVTGAEEVMVEESGFVCECCFTRLREPVPELMAEGVMLVDVEFKGASLDDMLELNAPPPKFVANGANVGVGVS